MSTADQFRDYPILAGLSDVELTRLSACLVKRSFAKGAYLYYPGNPSLNMYLIESGLVRLFFANTRGEEFLMNLIRPGASVGLPLLMDGQVRLTGAAAQQDTVALIFSREEMFEFMQYSPQFARNMYLEMTNSMRRLTLYAQAHTMLDIRGRLASLLVYQAMTSQNVGADDIELPLTQAEVAGWVGASRGRINRVLSKMQQLNLIRLEGQKVYIHDLPGLMKMAEGLITYWV